MTTESKKQAEERYVKMLLDGVTEYTSIEAGEKPDFRVRRPGALEIAIEVTEYHPAAEGLEGVRRSAVEARWWKELAPALDRERQTKPTLQDVQVLLGFSGRTPPTRGKHKLLATELARLIEQVAERLVPGQEVEVTFLPANLIATMGGPWDDADFWAAEEEWPQLSKELSSLYVSRWPGERPNWRCQDVGTAWSAAEVEEFRRILEGKTAKAQHYDLGGAPLWLLIVCEVFGDLQSHIFPRTDADVAQLHAALEQTGFDFQGGPFSEVWLLSEFANCRLRLHPRGA
jgi:hypothetical protein